MAGTIRADTFAIRVMPPKITTAAKAEIRIPAVPLNTVLLQMKCEF